jgi:hypothetical protein
MTFFTNSFTLSGPWEPGQRESVSCGCIVGADLRVRPVSGAQQAIGEPQTKGEPLGKGEHTGSPLHVCSFYGIRASIRSNCQIRLSYLLRLARSCSISWFMISIIFS